MKAKETEDRSAYQPPPIPRRTGTLYFFAKLLTVAIVGLGAVYGLGYWRGYAEGEECIRYGGGFHYTAEHIDILITQLADKPVLVPYGEAIAVTMMFPFWYDPPEGLTFAPLSEIGDEALEEMRNFAKEARDPNIRPELRKLCAGRTIDEAVYGLSCGLQDKAEPGDWELTTTDLRYLLLFDANEYFIGFLKFKDGP